VTRKRLEVCSRSSSLRRYYHEQHLGRVQARALDLLGAHALMTFTAPPNKYGRSDHTREAGFWFSPISPPPSATNNRLGPHRYKIIIYPLVCIWSPNRRPHHPTCIFSELYLPSIEIRHSVSYPLFIMAPPSRKLITADGIKMHGLIHHCTSWMSSAS